MAHTNAPHDGKNDPEHQSDAEEEVKKPKLILPPNEFDAEELRTPYANEMLTLTFEGHHKKFDVSYEPDGGAPKDCATVSETENGSLLSRVKRFLSKLLQRS